MVWQGGGGLQGLGDDVQYQYYVRRSWRGCYDMETEVASIGLAVLNTSCSPVAESANSWLAFTVSTVL